MGRMMAGSCLDATTALHARQRREKVTCGTDCEMYTLEGNALKQIGRCDAC